MCNVVCMQYYTIGKPWGNPMLSFYPDRGTESVELWRVQYYCVINQSYGLHKLFSKWTNFILNTKQIFRHMALPIHVLACDRHKHVSELKWVMGSHPW